MQETRSNKISSAFRARLDATPANTLVRAVVLLDLFPPSKSDGERLSVAEKRSVATATQKIAQKALRQLDLSLQSTGGKRLQDQPNVLGTILVEATAAGVEELARLNAVKAVLEDQNVNPLLFPFSMQDGSFFDFIALCSRIGLP